MMMTGVGVCVKGSKNNNKTNQGIIGKFLSVECVSYTSLDFCLSIIHRV